MTLVSFGLDADGALAVRTAKRATGRVNIDWQLDDMLLEAQPVKLDGKKSPLDLEFSSDVDIVFHLAPKAWVWDDRNGKEFFLKSRTLDGKTQPHNPFGDARRIAGHPDMIAVRYDPDPAYRGCVYEYNLGLAVRQGTLATPLTIDPGIKNGGGGGN